MYRCKCRRSTNRLIRLLAGLAVLATIVTGPLSIPGSDSNSSPLVPLPSVAAAPLPWIPATALIDVNFSAHRPPATGCPPPPDLCRLEHVFDEIVVIGLPRYAWRAARITGQLAALDTPVTLVYAFDTRVIGPAANSRLRPAEFALWLTHVAIFQYVAKSPFRHVFLIEDDATLASDFPSAFDAFARALPPDWRFLMLGQSLLCTGRRSCTSGLPSPVARIRAVRGRLYASFSVAFERAAAADVALANAASKDIIDRVPYEAVWAKWGNQSYFAWPPVVAMDPFTGSTLGNSWVVPVMTWKEQNGIETARFDFRGGGYQAHRVVAPVALDRDCDAPNAIIIGLDFSGSDITWGWPFDKQKVAPLPADNPRECCVHCVDAYPMCIAWTHVADVGCFIKQAVSKRVEGKGERFASGLVYGHTAQVS